MEFKVRIGPKISLLLKIVRSQADNKNFDCHQKSVVYLTFYKSGYNIIKTNKNILEII